MDKKMKPNFVPVLVLIAVLLPSTLSQNVPTVTISQASYSTTVGTTITLGCSVSSNPSATNVFWQRNVGFGTETISIDNINYAGATVSSPSLTVLNADSADSGSYRCFATNSFGTGQSSQVTLSVSSSSVPTVTIGQSSYSTSTGTTITLSCSVSSNPSHTNVFWQRNVGFGTETISIDNINYSGATVSSPSLTVLNADSADSGSYTCFATNSVGTGQSSTTTLTVSGNTPTVTISQTSYSTTSGTTITLGCSVSGNPSVTNVFWQRNVGSGTQTISIDNINYSGATVNSPSLTILTADTSDSGTYTCFATNSVGTGQSSQITLTVSSAGNIPTVTISQASYSTTTGTTITLGCSVSGNPSVTNVFWQRNVGSGTQTISIDNINYSGASVSSPSLTILNADSSDSGTYTCFASNSVGTGQSSQTTLSVSGSIPSVTISQNSYSTSTGNTITLGCSVSGNPSVTNVFWQRNVGTGTQTITIDNINYSGATVSSPSLTILNADSSDSGTYTCFATNTVGTGQSSQTTLTVTGNLPTVTISQPSYSTSTGTTITLSCSVSGNPSVTNVFWQRDVGSGTQTITIDNTNYSGATVSSPSLTILNADSSDSGTYTCFATNSVGTGQSSQTTLTVTGNIPTVTITQASYSTTTGTTITLACSVSGNPSVTNVFWQRNVGSGTQTITIDNSNYSGATVSSPSLTILNADSSDSGTYTCFATNSVGTGQSSQTTLTVTGSIPTVTISQASYSTTTGTTITLGCSVSGNPSVTNVFWQRNVGSGTQTLSIDNINYSGATVSTPSLTILNADSSDSGTYTCFGSNSVGTGQSSQTTLTVTGNIPTVTISQPSYSTTTGTTITLGCTVSGNPSVTNVFWQRNIGSGTQTITVDNTNYSGATVSSPSLTILNADSSDSGTYTCFASNSVGTGQSSQTTLTVTGNIPTVTISQASYSTTTGTTITLGCTVSGNPSVTNVFWQRNVGSGTQTITIDNSNYSGATISSPSLTILNAGSSDSGTYTCFASNSVGTGQSSQTTLTVTGNIPTVIISQPSYSTTTGTTITLGCFVSGNPSVTNVFWQRNVGLGTQSITIDNINYSGSTPSSPSLTILNADSSDSGTYTCFASNSVGTGQSSQTTLTVSGNIPTVTISQPSYSTSTGTTITLACSVSGNPSVTNVFWQRDVGTGTQTITTDNINYSGATINSPSLTILNADSSDSGTYTCFATNSIGTGQSSQTTLTVTGNIPSVTISQPSYSTTTGTTITLGCSVSGNPSVTNVFWQRDVGSGTQTITIDNTNYSGATVSSPSLTVLNADSSDSGTYTCFATNSVGTGQSSQTTLTVTGNIPTVTISQASYSTTTGTTITLGCSVSGNPSVTNVFWQRNVGSGTQTISIDNINYSGASVSTPSLTILNADSSDSGTYTCFASNSVGTGQSSQTTLTVTGNIPTVTISQPSYSTTTGTTITLGCSVSGNPSVTNVFWQRDVGTGTQTITIDNTNYSGVTINSPSLTILNADSSDSGTYTCFATNSVGTGQSSQTTLTVIGSIPTATISQASYSTTTGTTITLGCSVSGNPSVTNVFWQRDVGSGTQTLTTDNINYSGATVSTPSLTILNADSSDSGTYTCFATNSVGTGQSSQTSLTVTGNIPTATVSQASYSTTTGTTITLGCSVSGNPSVTNVFWQRDVGSGTQTISIDNINYSGASVSTPSLTILNADSSDSGTYTCFATNSVGTGQSSQTTLTVTGSIPTAIISQASYSTTTGTTITLGCSVSGNPSVTNVFWQRDVGSGTQTISIDNVNYSGATVTSPSLTILSADSSDSGTYTCFASNSVGTGQSSQTTLTVTGSIPTATISQASYSTITGTTITLACSVSGNPSVTNVFWQRDVGSGTQTVSIDNISYSGASVSSPSLTILNADSSDSGSYTCFATNSVGTGQSSQTTLTVTGSIPTAVISQASYSTTIGTTITLGCSVSGNPSVTNVFWQRNVGSGTQTITIDNTNYSGATVSTPSLTILNADSSDSGSYTCFATNSVGTGQSSQTTLTVTGNIPTATISQAFYSTTTGTTITLDCSVSGNPSVTNVFWQRDVGSGTQTISIDNINYSGATVNSPSLTILNADSSDSGTYTCFATNSVGTGQSSQTTLTVTGNIPTTTISQASYSTITGTTITLDCSVSGNPSVTNVFWQRDVGSGTQTLSIDNINYSGVTVNSPSLTILNADSSDSGTYTCFATNSVGTGQSSPTTLTVTGSIPTAVISQASYSTLIGTTIILECTVSGNPSVTNVFWQRDVGSGTQTITTDNISYSGATVNTPSLTILNADSSDSGTYRCFASNSVGTGQSSQTTLTVTGSIPTAIISQASYSTTTGTTITLGCSVSGNPSVTNVFWQRDVGSGTQTISIDNINYSGASVSSPSLTILNADISDSGTYTCFATNSVGTGQSSQTTLTVTGNIPTAIISQTSYGTTIGTTITLGCTVSGNPSVTDVFWQRNVGSGTQTITIDNINYSGATVSSPSLTILNADSSDSGTYTCFATNSVGTGQSSQTTLTVTGSIPTATISQASYSTTTGTTITLGCSVSGNPSVTNVFWQRNQGLGTETITIDNINYSGATVNTPSLTILNADSSDSGTYTCFATNSVGTGQSSQTSLTVTGNIPTVTVSQSSYSTQVDTTITLGCTVSSNPAHTSVFWRRDLGSGSESITIDNIQFSGSAVSSPSLTILNANIADSGEYTCFATNSVGTGQSSQTTLSVTGNVPTVTIGQSFYSTISGTSITLGCTVSANPSYTDVFWRRNVGSGSELITVDDIKYSGSTVSTPSLTILNPANGDSGSYTCYASNSVGTGQSADTTLTVSGNVPIVTIAQSSYDTQTGTTITLGCSVSANPSHTSVFWRRNVGSSSVQSIFIDDVNYSGSTITSPSLTILNADITDSGTYTCFATNPVGTGQSSATTLTVTGDIPVVTISQSAYTTETGTSITLGCTVSANPSHTSVYWQRNVGSGTETIAIDNINYSGSTVNSPSLTVINADTADTGTYTCFATNSIGTGQSSSTTLTVTGTIPIVTIGQASYSVSTGQPVTLVCSVSATPTHSQVVWRRVINGVPSSISIDGNKYTGSTVTEPSLTIFNTVASDEGIYVCSATNSVGTGTSSQTSLDVVGNLPIVTVEQSGYTVTTGGTITLVCSVNASPAETSVSWRRLIGGVSTSITIDNIKYSGATVGSPSLTVTGAQNSDEGFYICQATNIVGTGESSTTYLSVSGDFPVVTIPDNTYSVLSGSSVTIDCTVVAVPTHTSVSWSRTLGTTSNAATTGITIDGVKYSGGSISRPSLTINNANDNDEGFYVCSATNVVGTGNSIQTYLSVTGAIPIVTVAQTSYSITTGSSVTLQCSAFGNPAVTSVSWTQTFSNGLSNGITIDGSKYSGGSINNPSLTIFNADSNDEGIYICMASNSIGSAQSEQVLLGVTGDPPTVTVSQTEYSVITGASVTLQCSVTAVPAANSVYWERTTGGVTSRININQVKYGGSTITSPSLIIYNTNAADDNGLYVCKATNIVGTGQSVAVTVTSAGSLPVVEIQESSYTVTTGTTATLVCTVAASPQASIVFWRKSTNGASSTDIFVDGGKYTGGSVSSPTLVIQNANSNDEGYYTCLATNAVGTGSSSQTYLSVTGALPIVQVLQPSYSVLRGQTVTLECTVTGTPSANSVAWTRTSGGVTTSVSINNSKYSGSTVSSPSLVIRDADSIDTGTYVCTATNSVGTGRSAQTTLSVTGDIPTVTIPDPTYSITTGRSITIRCTVSASPQISSVSWSKRNDVNGISSPITIDGSTYSGGSVGVPSLTIFSATAADQGYYVCSATNSIGTGQSGLTYLTVTGSLPSVTIPSNAYSVITGSSIQIPCTVNAIPTADSVTWTKTITSGSNVGTAISIDGSKYQGGSVGTPSLTINNANNNDQAYYVCSATNSVGSGQSIQTYLTVSGNIPTVQLAQTQYTTLLGTSVTIECTVSSTPQADSISWERVVNGVTTTLNIDGNKYVGSTVSNPSLTINSAAYDDEGYYVCIAINNVGIGRSSQGYLTIAGYVPSVVISKPSYTVVRGDSITIDCDYSASPFATSIYWTKIVNTETTQIVISNNNRYSGGTLSNPSLTIMNTNTDDQAFYKCIVGNSVGEGQSSQAYLYVTGNIPTAETTQSSYSVSIDDTVTISCVVGGVPSVTSVSWEYVDANGVTSTIDVANSRYSGSSVASPSLTISAARLSDQGTYKCKATNRIGTGASSVVYLYVTGTLPSVRVTVSSYTVDLGETATLSCIVDASPAATSVYWTKIVNGVSSAITTIGNKYGGSTPNTPSLVINNLVLGDEGSYRCSAVNTVGTGQSGLTTLIVGAPPTDVIVNPSSLTRREGESVTSECSANANPPATFQWVKDNTNEVVSTGRILQISNVDRGHDSTYTCTATNTQGSGSAKLNVDVQYRPISTVTEAEALVVLSLNAQRNLECNTVANPSVQSYRWVKDGNTISGVDSLVYTVIISDTNDYGVYTCYATNSIGESSAITFTVQSGTQVVSPTPSDEGLTTGLIVAIVVSVVVLLLIVIIIAFCCVTHGVCRMSEPVVEKRVITEKPAMRFTNPMIPIMPGPDMIEMHDEGFYRPTSLGPYGSQFQYMPQISYYETEGSRRERKSTSTY